MDILSRARMLQEKARRSIFQGARKLERRIRQRLQGSHVGEEPLEIWRGIAQDLEGEIRPVKGGYVFPHPQIALIICASSSEKKAAFKAAFDPSQLEQDIRQLLEDCECRVPDALHVSLRFTAQPQPDWNNPVYHLQYSGRARRPAQPQAPEIPAEPPSRITATLRILQGTAPRSSYRLVRDVTFIGRGVSFATSGVNHVNDIAFEDSEDPVNRSISRKHARIVYEPESGTYVLYDEASSRGTTLIRGGRSSRLPGGSRGRRLQPGDKILLGKAVVEFDG